MTFYLLEPEVAGDFGDGTVIDVTVHPPRVDRLVYRFQGWLGDELLESTPCFIVSNRLATKLEESGLDDFELRDVDVATEPEVTEQMARHGIEEFPDFKWLYVTGVAGRDDIGVTSNASLVVSDRALEILRSGRLDHCDIEPYGLIRLD